ncbi:TlpA disulfide reductase family protein [Rhizobium laguerreae]|uniref:TlpA disulfide reductase family protein n=1 Tax=Rhizobium laguerreae TaxID=1076926 RepID=UPI001C928083|nr:TlpA disulfide reductase family protein [Rhizobium laguerreae]MBY3349022.1 TlpA family protein disulfide reductase [Rhizobium laguerreae]MBY3356108.1 TlpA family protein disulfide reductase [Rhizobium laguerreae]MBY3370157.1 TlpA family protein disulfide reductase [Rhizobium laguerreae]MBY3377171.1 TlpA family protein disulfide reductase [Rhizobium laguerreae]MBY3390980.1 TlpA family protein disulfide reductase [Rhizobium laguerreae]
MTSSLNSGSPAPLIDVQDWLRGDRISNFQPGKIYILEFFSTTCSGCGPALSHLAQLQEEYSDMGVELIGVAANEKAATADEARAQVDAWASKWLPNTNIRIAFDYSGEMARHWLLASLTFHVPQAFVVDRDGSIVFIGLPHLLDEVLPKVIDGRWRASAEAINAEEERIAKAEIDAPKRALFDRIKAATEIEDWKTALSAIEEGINRFPGNIMFHQWHVGTLMGEMRDMEAGWIALGQFARTAIERNSEEWLLTAMQQLFYPYDYSGLLAERLSMGKELSERILRLYPQQGSRLRFHSYTMIAFYYHESGDNDRAVDLIEQALTFVDEESLPDVKKQKLKAQLLSALAEYKGEQV